MRSRFGCWTLVVLTTLTSSAEAQEKSASSVPFAMRDDLSIQMMAPGETRSTHLITLDREGVLVLAELKIDVIEPSRDRTPEQLAARQLARKACVAAPRWPLGGTLGEEFKPFWQKLADQALAAIRRHLLSPESIPIQETPVMPELSVSAIIACASAQNCKGMQASRLNWFDVIHIPVLTFTDGGVGFAIRPSREGLSIWITPTGDTRPTMLVAIGEDGKVRTGGLGPQPGERVPQMLRTAAELEASRQVHKAFRAGGDGSPFPPWGEEFRAFWQAEADKALAAIVRTITSARAQEKPVLGTSRSLSP